MAGRRDAHFGLKITPEIFDEVRTELGRTLDQFKVPNREREGRNTSPRSPVD